MAERLCRPTHDDDIEIITHETLLEAVEPETPASPDIDEADSENFQLLSTWFIKNVGILPSLDKLYCSKLFDEGIGSVHRLARKLLREPKFLNDIDFKPNDIEEIFDTLRREGLLPPVDKNEDIVVEVEETKESLPPRSTAPTAPAADESTTFTSIANSAYIEHATRKRRHRGEHSEKFQSLVTEATGLIENLRTAIEGKMDLAVVGVLHSMATFIEHSHEKQRAMYRANAAPVVVAAMSELGAAAAVCEKALITMALLCRYSDENKSSFCFENAKALGVAGACELIAACVSKYSDDVKVLEVTLDAIRCISCLESNRVRFGEAGVCETVSRCLTKYSNNPELCRWICRALGHLTNGSDDNREFVGAVGACESIIVILQNYQTNTNVCAEICWAIRNMAPTENNRARFSNEHGPECLAAVYKYHTSSEVFAIEACRALVSLIASEDDDIIARVAYSGVLPAIIRSYKKNSDSEILARWVFNLMYYVACDVRLIPRLMSCDILTVLSATFDNHAGYEPLAEWGLRTVPKLTQLPGILPKMRNAGLCEVTVSTVQRQAISSKVCGHGCLAIGELASDLANHDRLSTAGASEATIGALRRHDSNIDVVSNACYAIHFLCGTENITSWMGANGACEAVTNALVKHSDTSVLVTKFATRALGSLAYRDDGNLLRLNVVDGCGAVVKALKTYAADVEVAEYGCRAIYNFCYESTNVSALGKKAACGTVVSVLQLHTHDSSVVTQACLAIHGLAVKYRIDKVHLGNTNKLAKKGALEIIISVMQKFPTNAEVQQASALAIASMGRLEANRNKLGSLGACELIVTALNNHSSNGVVVGKLALAVEVLSQGSEAHKAKFHEGNVVEVLLTTLNKQDRIAVVVTECFRALIVMLSYEPSRPLIRSEGNLKQAVKVIRYHEKDPLVGRYGCNFIYSSATDDVSRARLGAVKACEAVTAVLSRHGENSAAVAAWGCKAMFALSVLEANKPKFANSESCNAIVKALKENYYDLIVAEWACAAIVSIAPLEGNRIKLGSGGGCSALQATLARQFHSEVITRLACEAIYELAPEAGNKQLFGIVGICETLANAFSEHINSASVCQQICRAISALARHSSDNEAKFGAAGVCELIGQAQKFHSFNVSFAEWSSACITSLSEKNEANQSSFGQAGVCENLIGLLKSYRSNELVIAQASRAVRALSVDHVDNIKRFSVAGIIGTTLACLKVHVNNNFVAENSGWILTKISTPTFVEGSSTADAAAQAKDLYKSVAAWDLMAQALQTHCQREQTVRWLTSAIKVFAARGQLPHVPICDAIIASISAHLDKEKVLEKLLVTVGTLAETNIENSNRLAKLKVCELVDSILTRYYSHMEAEVVVGGCFQAIVGLVANNPNNQEKFYLIPTFSKNVLKNLYNDLESETVSKWGCAAISGLAWKHRFLQTKLGGAGNYLVDIIQIHKALPDICTEVCRTVSRLAHANITNRNRLGSSGICDELPKIIHLHVSREDGANILHWAVRAIADLAANNPNNQTRLGLSGCCEALVMVLRLALASQTPDAVSMVKWACWAIGNMVQLGKGPTMIIDESSTGMKLGQFKALRATSTVKNTSRLSSAGVAELIVTVLAKFKNNDEVLQWCLRAVNNLAKSRSMKAKLLENPTFVSTIQTIADSSSKSEVKYWAISASKTLTEVTPAPPAGVLATPVPRRESFGLKDIPIPSLL